MKISSYLVILILILYGLIFLSPLWRSVIPIGISPFLAALMCIVGLVHTMSRRKVSLTVLCILCCFFILSSIAGIYWNNLKIAFFPSFFAIALWIIYIVSTKELKVFVRLISYFIILILVLSWIGFIYAFMGGDPMFSIINPDGRENFFYLSTLSNVRIGNLIRPSGIFDEPGTLAFVISAIASVRHLMRLNRNITWVILSFGIITTSLALVVYIIFHIAAEKNGLRISGIMICVGALLFISLHQTPVGNSFDRLLLSRLQIQDSQLSGDNRTERMMVAVEHLSLSTAFVGLDLTGTVDAEQFKRKYPLMGENPLAPLVQQGLLLTIGFYVLLSALLIKGFTKREFLVLVGLAVLFMQRPYVMDMGYALWALIPLMLAFGKWKVYKMPN